MLHQSLKERQTYTGDDAPAAVAVRQMMAVFAQFERTKLKGQSLAVVQVHDRGEVELLTIDVELSHVSHALLVWAAASNYLARRLGAICPTLPLKAGHGAGGIEDECARARH
jgi:hypothetical protein